MLPFQLVAAPLVRSSLLWIVGANNYEVLLQELCVDESVVKYKGHCKSKVCMPKKPIKLGIKIWCCFCSCCGYLCTFQFYDGMPVDVVTGERCLRRIWYQILYIHVSPFTGMNHVLYCDNFLTSGPLVNMLANDKIVLVGSIRKAAADFPNRLKTVTPP